MIDCPCHGCLRRNSGCHSTCPEYAEYKATRARFAEERRKNAQAFSDYLEVINAKRNKQWKRKEKIKYERGERK